MIFWVKGNWYASTPAGTVLPETGAATKEECIARLLEEGRHMPYGTWENFKARGYTLEQWEVVE